MAKHYPRENYIIEYVFLEGELFFTLTLCSLYNKNVN